MTPELEAIKDQLATRNVIAFTQEQRYSVNMVRTGHEQRVIMVCINGKVIAEAVFTGSERLPAIMELFRLRKVFGCERVE